MKKTHIMLILFVFGSSLGWTATTEKVKMDAKNIWGDTAKKITYLQGNVVINQGQTRIDADWAEIDMENKKAFLNNGVKLRQLEIGITANQLHYDLRQKVGTFEQQVRLERTQVKNAKDKKEPFVLRCEQLYLEANTKNFNAQTDVRIAHSEFDGSADEADYHDKNQILSFHGHALLKRPQKNESGKVKEAFQLTGDRIDLEVNTKNFKATGAPALKHADFDGLAQQIDYFDNRQELLFRDQVVLKRAAKQEAGQGKEPFELRSDQLVMEVNSRNFVGTGQVKLVHPDFEAEAAKINYHDLRQELTFTEQVRLRRVQQTGSQGKTKAKEPFDLGSDQLVLDLNSKNFIATGNATIRNEDFQGAADRIEYDDAKQQLLLKGNARLKRPKGEEVTGDQLRVNLNDKSFVVLNQVSLMFEVKENQGKATAPPKR